MTKTLETKLAEQAPVAIVASTAANAKENIVDDSKFSGMIRHIAKSGKAVRELIQSAAMQALIYAFIHENYDRLTVLFYTVTENMSERNARQVQLWIEAHSPAAMRKTEDKNYPEGKKFRKSKSDNANPFNIETAFNTPWYTMEGLAKEEIEKLFGTSTFVERLEKMVKDITKAQENNKVLPDDAQTVNQIKQSIEGVLLQFKPTDKEVTNEVTLVKVEENQEKAA